MSKVFKSLKKVASVALPVAASFIPGVGPLGMALAGAAGGALGGGGLQGALLGGALGGLGGGLLGGAPGVSGIGAIDSLNNSLYGAMSPLRSLASNIGGSISKGISDFASPLKSLFGGGGDGGASVAGALNQSAAPSVLPSLDSASSVLSGATSDTGSGIFSKLKEAISNPSISDLATGAMLLQALNPTEPEGMRSQQDILNEMQQSRDKQQQQNTKFLESLNSTPLNRQQTAPQIDYYHYGSRPEELFFDEPSGGQIQFMKEGGSVSPLKSLKPQRSAEISIPGGQDDTIDAKLSEEEFVLPSDVVSSLGDGSSKAGAKKLYKLIKDVRKHKAPAMKRGSLPPRAKSPLAYAGALK